MILAVARARTYEPGLNMRGEQEPQPWLFLLPDLELSRVVVVGEAPRGTRVALSSLAAEIGEATSVLPAVDSPVDLVYITGDRAALVAGDERALAVLRRLLGSGGSIYISTSGRRSESVRELVRVLGVAATVRLARASGDPCAADPPSGPTAWLIPDLVRRPSPKVIRGIRRISRRVLRHRPLGSDEPLLAVTSVVPGPVLPEPRDGVLVHCDPPASGFLPRYLRNIARAAGYELDGCGWVLTPPRGYRSQKVVFQLPERDLVVKVTQDPVFNRSLQAEYDALVELEEWATSHPGAAPRPLFAGEHAGLLVIGESRLDGVPFHRRSDGTATCPIAAATLETLLELSAARQQSCSGMDAADALAELLEAYARICAPPAAQVRYLEQQLASIAESDSSFATVFSHGDPTTHNVLVDDAGGIGLVDWENAEGAGMPLWDTMRFVSAYAARSATLSGRRWTATVASAYLFEPSPFQRLLGEWIGRNRTVLGLASELVAPLILTCLSVDALRQATRLPAGSSSRTNAAHLLALLTRDRGHAGLRALAHAGG